MRRLAVPILGLLGPGLLVLGAVLVVSGLQSHDSWGFGAAYTTFGFILVMVGVVLLAVAWGSRGRQTVLLPLPDCLDSCATAILLR